MTGTRAVALSVFAAALVLGPQSSQIQGRQTAEELQQLVAPVALYPDALLAEVLVAATYPSDVDEAAAWLQRNAHLTSDQIAVAVDAKPWDSSVKALTEFPMVLAYMDQNLSWTSALGDAYFNQPDEVMDAVQALRRRAIAAGTLRSNSQITVSYQGGIVVIASVIADTVYVPTYDCWNDFGTPIDPWPYFAFAPGFVRGRIVWSVGFHVGGVWGRVTWAWHNWGCDWGRRRVVFHRAPYLSHSPSVIDRRYTPFAREPLGGAIAVPRPPRGATPPPTTGRVPGRPVAPAPGPPPPPVPAPGRPIIRPAPISPGTAVPRPGPGQPAGSRIDRGYPQPQPGAPPAGTRSGAMSGIGPGGAASSNSSRGRSSMGAPSTPAPPTPPRSGPGRAGPDRGRSGRETPPPAPARGRGRS